MGKSITQQDAAGPLTGAEKIPMVQEGKTVRAQLSSFTDFLGSGCKCTLVSRPNSVSAPDSVFEEYLQTYQMSPNTLKAVGDWVQIISFGQFAANSSVKNIFIEFKEGVIYDDISTSGSIAETAWEINSILTKSSATNVKVKTTFTIGGTSISSGKTTAMYTAATISTLDPIDISVGSYGLSAAGDVVVESFIVELHQVDTNS